MKSACQTPRQTEFSQSACQDYDDSWSMIQHPSIDNPCKRRRTIHAMNGRYRRLVTQRSEWVGGGLNVQPRPAGSHGDDSNPDHLCSFLSQGKG